MRSLILLLMLISPLVNGREVTSVTVYTLSTLPVTGSIDHRQVLLDEAEGLLTELGFNLPNNLEGARHIVLQRIDKNTNLITNLGNAFNGVVEAWTLGIERLPAIIINDKYLIYGVYDLDAALMIFKSTKL